MQKQTFSECVRCGTPRVLLKRWTDHGENGKGALIVHEETTCPDLECQKILNERFQEMRDRRTQAEERKKAVILERSEAKRLKLEALTA